MESFSIIEKILKETEKYYLYITNETLIAASGVRHSLRALENGVRGRGIRQTGFTQPRIVSDNTIDAKIKNEMNGDKHLRAK